MRTCTCNVTLNQMLALQNIDDLIKTTQQLQDKLSILKISISEITENVMKHNTEILHYACITFDTQGCIATIMYKSVIFNKERRVFKTQICSWHRVVDCRAHVASTIWYTMFE